MTPTIQRGLGAVRRVLPNGCVTIVKEARTIPAITVQASIRAGGIYEPPEQVGLSHLLARAMDRGTERRTADEIAEALDMRGVSLTVTANRHLLTIGCTCLTEDFKVVLDILGDIIMRPVFPADEIEKRRDAVLTSIRQDEDNPAAMAFQGLFGILYPDNHPYGRPGKGYPHTIAQIDRGALRAFHAARFAPSTLSLVIVGDVDPEHAAAECDRFFGLWTAPAPPEVVVSHPPLAVSRRERVITMMNKAQADIAYGFITIKRTDPAFYAYTLMNNALGQYGIGGRLGDSIRERQGMAYYVFSSFDAHVVEGPLLIRAGVNPANVERAVASIDAEIAKMAADGMTDRELADCKQYLIGSIPRLLETNAAIATFLQTAEFFGLGHDHDLRLPALLGAVTLDDVNAAARESLATDRAAVVVAGPYQK